MGHDNHVGSSLSTYDAGHSKGSHYVMGTGIGIGLMGFIVIFTFVWVLLYSFNPSFVQKQSCDDRCDDDNDEDADPARALVASLVISLLLLVIFWMFWSCA